jgi:hypothetical protein
MGGGMSLLRQIASALARLFNWVFGGIRPPEVSHPPDVDGRRDSGDLSFDRAVLEAKMRDQVGPGGTPG